MLDKEKIYALVDEVITIETHAVAALRSRINDNFIQACELLLNCQGRIVVLGVGKSGHIANKIAATLASTGSPAFFIHPTEACHGDIGMITRQDVALLLSNSGETAELLALMPVLKRLHVPIIAITGRLNSSLASHALINLDASVAQEACPLGLAPTSSTTAALVMGDALAVALLQARGFTLEDYALSHPGGSLGRRLLLKVADVMRTGDALPIVYPDASISNALLEMTRKGLGMTLIIDSHSQLLGVFTDGDLRRTIDTLTDWHHTPIQHVMTRDCKTITADTLAVDALNELEAFKIMSLVVINTERQPVGVIHMHDLLRAGVV